MVYPNRIDRFPEKLNKKPDGSVHTVEEEVIMTNGIYEGYLRHDNIRTQSIQIYTESKYSGKRIDNYFLSVNADTPWKQYIKVFSDSDKVYITYDTTGDQVEASDINTVQDAITATQEEIERYKEFGLIDGGTFERG